MSKLNINTELTELIGRFRELKKAIAEENKYTPAQRAAMQAAEQFTDQLPKVQPLKKTKAQIEQQQAQALANTLQKAGVLGGNRIPQQPTSAQQEAWLAQNGYGNEAMLKSQEDNWGNSINNWLTEATKPLNQRFDSPEAERAYWDSIKINGGSGGNEGAGY